MQAALIAPIETPVTATSAPCAGLVDRVHQLEQRDHGAELIGAERAAALQHEPDLDRFISALACVQNLRPSTFFTFSVSTSTPSRQRAFTATISAPSGPLPCANDWMPQVAQNR